MHTLFLIQINSDTNLPSVEGVSFVEAVRYENWFHPHDAPVWDYTFDFVAAMRIEKQHPHSVIPIGSIEFVQYFLKVCHYPILEAVNLC